MEKQYLKKSKQEDLHFKKAEVEDLHFKKAYMEDLHQIFDIFTKAILNMKHNGIDQWDEMYPTIEVLKKDIEENQLYIGTIHNDIASVFVLNKEFDEEYKTGQWKYEAASFGVVHRLCVNPIFQKQGVATKTMLYIEEVLREQGVETIRLDTFTQNPLAIGLYTKLGYEKVGYVNWRKGQFHLLEKKL